MSQDVALHHDPTIPMTRQEVLQLIQSILIELFAFEPKQVIPSAHIAHDLDLDSIDAVDIIVKIQERTGRSIDPDSFRHIETIQDIVDIACQIP